LLHHREFRVKNDWGRLLKSFLHSIVFTLIYINSLFSFVTPNPDQAESATKGLWWNEVEMEESPPRLVVLRTYMMGWNELG